MKGWKRQIIISLFNHLCGRGVLQFICCCMHILISRPPYPVSHLTKCVYDIWKFSHLHQHDIVEIVAYHPGRILCLVIPRVSFLMSLVNVLGAETNPNGRQVHCKFPRGKEKPSIALNPYPFRFASIHRQGRSWWKKVAFDNLVNMSSGLKINSCWLSHLIQLSIIHA